MIGMRSLAAFALASVAAFTAACSSGSSSGSGSGSKTTFVCGEQNPTSMTDQACVSCLSSNCSAEASAAYGSSYASLDLSGGACGPFITCIAACACNDTTCVTNCASKETMACETASTNFDSCLTSKCDTQCDASASSSGTSSGTSTGTSSSGSAGSSSGSATGTACDISAEDTCFVGFPASSCSAASGTSMASCPTTNLSGCCTASGSETCFYMPSFSASVAMQACTEESGTFSTTP